MLLTVKNLGVTVTDHKVIKSVVNDVSFAIAPKSTTVLLGESGSGKTLTALSVMRLLPPAAHVLPNSQIILEEIDLLNLPEVQMQKIRGRKIGMVFQEPMTALNPVLTIGEQLSEVLRHKLKLNFKAAQQRVFELLTEVNLPATKEFYENYPHQLSGGMQQRVVIAGAVAAEPQLLIADEPTSALDVVNEHQILKLLAKLQNKLNLAILFITHDVRLAKQIADQIIVLQKGSIVEQATANEFFTNPQHAYSKQLIDAAKLIPKSIPAVTTASSKPILTTKDLCIYFPIRRGLFKRTKGWVKAVNKINLSLHPGRTLALVGESGCGKTTLGRGLLRLVEPTSGEILFKNLDLTELSLNSFKPIRKDLQIIFQDPYASLNPRMVVGDIIAEGLVSLNLVKSNAEKNQRIDELLQQVGLPIDSKHRYPHEFSGGQRQRIVIARALAVKPKLIICDEPTSALDVNTQKQIMNLLLKLQAEFNLSYLFITHSIPLAASFADEIAVMQRGEIIEHNTTEKLLSNPQQDYTRLLLKASLINS